MKKLLLIPLTLFAQSVLSDPFPECPADSFLTQGTRAQTYAVNLATGDYKVAAKEMGTKRPVNAMGFNPVDNYMYGWSYEHRVPVRIHSNFKVEPLKVKTPGNQYFYAGDVHPTNNEYYVYRSGSSYGLFKMQLDANHADYLKMIRIIDGKKLSVAISDLAINPLDGFAYTVTIRGDVYQIDLNTGAHQVMGKSGVSGRFGAMYFDAEGNLYISRNNDGHIFRIPIAQSDYTASFLAKGPASSTNDGARCAAAAGPVVTTTNMDFGDAPDTYGTLLESDGARHELSKVFLGSHVDGESDSSLYPLSDDKNDRQDDEDGVQLATSLIQGSKAVVVVKSSGKGYLNGWIDIDGDGTFSGADQVFNDVEINSRRQTLYLNLPFGAKEGKTWARVRFSSQPGLLPTGAAADGEVEDYQVKIQPQKVTVNHYPSASGWTTLAFEDNWPQEGDYDMNDLIVFMRTSVAHTSDGVVKATISGEVAAVGAAYHNGFAVRLPGVKYSQVDHAKVKYTINDQPVKWQPIEGGREEAILMVTYNLWDYIGNGEDCLFYRTETGCGSAIELKFEAEIPMLEPVATRLKGVMDPFLFATPGAWHGGHFVTAPGRGYEIHLKNQSPTEAFDHSLFEQAADDASDPERGKYFQTENGLPWVLEIGTRWEYPIEYHDIGHAYPLFSKYARSGGLNNRHWYNKKSVNRKYIFEN